MEEKKGLFDLAMNTFRLRRKIEEETGKVYGIPAIEVNILAYLYLFRHDATASGIERERNLKKNTISVHVENLVQAEFVARKERQGDRRRVELDLTARGEEVAKHCLAEHERLNKMLVKGIPEEEQKVLLKCLQIIDRNAQRLLEE